MVENLKGRRQASRYEKEGHSYWEKNLKVNSSVLCSSGGPYCIIISFTPSTIPLKSAVGKRERRNSNVGDSIRRSWHSLKRVSK